MIFVVLPQNAKTAKEYFSGWLIIQQRFTMIEIKNFFYAKGIKKFTDEEIIGLPIPLEGEMAIIRYEDLKKVNFYKGEIEVPLHRVRQSSFKGLTENEITDFLRRLNNA
jgi:hypothetical protein